MKRLFTLLALLLIAALALSACNGDTPNPPDTTDTTATETTPPIPSEIDIVKDGVANYTIVRPDNADQATVEAASRLRKLIAQYTGVSPILATDWIKPGSDYDHSTFEILIGRTAYSESSNALDTLTYGDFIIKADGNKLVINAWSADGLSRAITELADEMIASATDGNFSLPGNFQVTDTAIEGVNTLPIYPNGSLDSIYTSTKDVRLLIFEETNASAYDTYLNALKANGYTEYAQNNIAENKFSTYVTDAYVVNLAYYAHKEETRITIEPRTTLPITEAENTYQKAVEPKFTMIGLESQSDLQNGMSFVWQLADGSYIIVDGGFNNVHDTQTLYRYMKNNAPDPENITIAAWLITHGHGDHHGAYYRFSEVYGKKVNVELVIGNFPTSDFIEGGVSPNGVSSIVTNAQKYFAGSKFLTAHTGQKLYLRDAVLEILYTQEDILPQTFSDLNTASLAFSITLGGQRFLILGDADELACAILYHAFGDYLKSDFIQTSHHGYSNGSSGSYGTLSVYKAAAAPVVLWPVGDYNYKHVVGAYSYSKYLQEAETTKEIVVAGSRTFTISLPYTYGTSGFDTILK
ncbi:MAG: hypothetical protein IJF49_06365 [Clostridia bacterium]|nr:hypothetical protein [Clostridia bacterium]